MSKHRFMIELINKEDVIDECNAEVWEGEALANIRNFKPILTVPEKPTNGDMIKSIFQNFLFIPCEKHNLLQMLLYEDNETQKGLIECIEFELDWWNAPYKTESEDRNE